MLTSIGLILDGSPKKASRIPVRRGSHLAGRHEATFWRATDRQEVRRIVLAARRYELTERRAGRRNGPLGHVALEVLELLGNLVRYKTGRLEPSLEFLMQTLRRSKDAVVRALRVLRTHGFLDWLRRYVPTGREGRGPQVRQTSNAYRLSMPARAMRLLGRLAQRPPVPEDVSHAQETRQAEVDAYCAGLPLNELALLKVDDGPLARLLAQLGSRVQERESARQTELKARKTP